MASVVEHDPVSQQEMASICGVTAQTVLAWERKGCPVHEKGARGKATLYQTAPVIAWLRAQSVSEAIGTTGPAEDLDYNQARKRKMIAEAQLAELEVAKKAGDLISLSLAIGVVQNLLTNLKVKLLAIGPRVAPRLEALKTIAERRAAIDEAIREALRVISKDPSDFLGSGAVQVGDGDDDSDGDGAADRSDSKRVGRRRAGTVV